MRRELTRTSLTLLAAVGILTPLRATAQEATPTRIVDAMHSSDTSELIGKIHSFIVATSSQENASHTSYDAVVPLTGAPFSMIAIEGGSFMMGSPDDEADRQENEGPQTKIQTAPFWMGKTEVTWDEYEPYMITQVDREKHGARKDYDPSVHTMVDGVSQPTPPYTEMSFGMVQLGYPAVCMTQHAANKYCQWLSAQTGHFYRLPTEAEWEYACRAGSTGPYSFDVDEIDDYAWYYDNSNDKYQKVGQKKPNAWGLHDMHGNVLEWTADQYIDDYFDKVDNKTPSPWIRGNLLYPRSVRGGSWYDDPDQLRSAFRRGSEESWKAQDPQLPKSIWYHTDAPWLGFRIVRPLEVPSAEIMEAFWNHEKDTR